MVQLHIGILAMHLGHHILPELKGLQHIGLVHAGDLATPLARGLEGHVRDALDFRSAVAHRVERFLAARKVPIDGHTATTWLTEVDVACQLPDDENVQPRHQFGLQA
jgi:hypothetical protein